MLTVKSGLDPYMIIILEYDLNYGYWKLLGYVVIKLWFGIYLYLLVNRCLIKFDQLKMLNAAILSAFHFIKPCMSFISKLC